MKFFWLLIPLAVAACDRPQSVAQQPIEQARQAEQAAETRRPLADASLADIVKQALRSDTSIDARKIDVENRSGNVALHGTVETPEQKEKVERIVMSVGGVRSVSNNLAIADS